MPRNLLKGLFLLLALAALTWARAAEAKRRAFPDSIASVSPTATPGRPRLARTSLSVEEHAAPVDIVISLAMRNYAEFEARIMRGEKIAQAEMEENYLPLRADHGRVRDWALAQGFRATLADSNHTSLFVRGSVDQAAAAFQTTFARVATADGEFTSAISAPSLPVAIAGPVLHIEGLQPHLRARPREADAPLVPSLSGFATPADVTAAYDIPANLTGTGQTIAIYGWGAVSLPDLSAFWTNVGSAQSTANVTILDGADAIASASYIGESMLDVEWAGAFAPSARLRFYTQPLAGSVVSLATCATQVLNDAKTDPTITVLSCSVASPEAYYSTASLASVSQLFGQLAAAGITTLASSGDGGSNPRIDGVLGFQASSPTLPEYPASDPNVTGVGGTSLVFDSAWSKTDEIAWNEFGVGRTTASGGGYSSVFAKPRWQAGSGSALLSAATSRCVPDIAACSHWGITGNLGFYMISDGKVMGTGGTSLSAPVFAGIVALINQARAAAGHAAIGLLNPWLYPQAAGASFNAITSGNNGAYSAGPIYNLCTGLGSPDVANLIAVLAGTGSTLSNMSVRTNLASAQSLTVGFVTTGPKSLLIRAVGPGLNAVFGLPDFYADPKFSLISQGLAIDQNDDWNPALSPTFARVGAFALAAGSKDAALQHTITGATTAEAGGAGSGIMLLEVYDADLAASSSRLINVSARNQVGTGANILVSGFVISGILPRPLLVRGIGPGLHDIFGLNGVLADPILEIHQTVNGQDTVIAANDNWDAGLSATFDRVGAYHFAAGSKDAALALTLPPGVYTAQLSGANNGTGDGVLEIYEVP